MERKKAPRWFVNAIVVCYATGILTLMLLAAGNYPVQWRDQVNIERRKYLEVIAQALEYYYLDHGRTISQLPSTPSIISNINTCSFECPALGKSLPCYNLQRDLVPGYVREIPQDPFLDSDSDSGFYIVMRDRTVTVGACRIFFKAELAVTVTLD